MYAKPENETQRRRAGWVVEVMADQPAEMARKNHRPASKVPRLSDGARTGRRTHPLQGDLATPRQRKNSSAAALPNACFFLLHGGCSTG